MQHLHAEENLFKHPSNNRELEHMNFLLQVSRFS
jgi:hypothetical protein